MAQDDIQGQVVDASGNPVEGAIVELTRSYQSSPTDEQVVRRTTTDNNGNYIFDYHPDGDGSTQEWHVSCYNYDGTAYVNSENNPGVTADLSAIPDSGIARWNFEDDSDTTTAVDSWNNNDGTINGATYTTDSQVGALALNYDGADDYVDIPDIAGGFGAFSFGGWVKLSGGGVRPRILGSASNSVALYDKRNDSDGWAWIINDNDGGGQIIEGSNSYTNGSWIFLVGVYDKSGLGDGSTMKIYQNDANEIASGSPASSDIVPANLQLGVRPDNAGDRWEGPHDDLRAYSKALSAAEVSNWYNTGNISG